MSTAGAFAIPFRVLGQKKIQEILEYHLVSFTIVFIHESAS